MKSRLARVSLVLVAFVVLMVAPASGGGLVSCRPNIFGGEDCTGPRGRSSSRPNIFGGYDTTYADGSRTESRPNIFGGQVITTSEHRSPNVPGLHPTSAERSADWRSVENITLDCASCGRSVTLIRGRSEYREADDLHTVQIVRALITSGDLNGDRENDAAVVLPHPCAYASHPRRRGSRRPRRAGAGGRLVLPDIRDHEALPADGRSVSRPTRSMTSRADCMERRLKNDAYYPTDLGAWNF